MPEKFTNLQVLPNDIPRGELIGIMRRFTSSLGLRCNDCQVEANPGQQPEHLDFPLDDEEQKKVARVMLKMVIDINGKYLPETGRTFTARTRVTCETCHHGAPKPRTLAAELMGALEAKGIDSSLARYRELQEKSYGRAMFDFGEQSLRGDTAAALTTPNKALAFAPSNPQLQRLMSTLKGERPRP